MELKKEIDLHSYEKIIHKKIDSLDDLNQILLEISKSKEFSWLQISLSEKKWIVDGELYPIITNISFTFIGSDKINDLELISKNFIGKKDSKDISKTLIERIKSHIRSQGHSNISININRIIKYPYKIHYNIQINTLPPAQIEKIHFPKKRGVKDLSSLIGQSCHVKQLKSLLDEHIKILKEAGYYKANLKITKIILRSDKIKCDLYIEGEVGPKYEIEIIEDSGALFLDSFFKKIRKNKITLSTADPEIIEREISKKYSKEGYYDIEIKFFKKIDAETNTIKQTYLVKKGQAYKTSSIKFHGNKYFSTKKIYDNLQLKRYINSEKNMTDRDIQKIIAQIKKEYLKEGFWNTKVRLARFKKDPTVGTISVVFSIEDGERQIFENIIFSGNKIFSDEHLKSLILLKKNVPIKRDHLKDLDNLIRREYIKKGYSQYKASFQLKGIKKRNLTLATVLVKISEGLRVRFANVYIRGVKKTKHHVIRRELKIKPGDFYNNETIRKSRESLLKLGLFKNIRFEESRQLDFTRTSRIVDLIVNIEEAPAGSITFGPGFSLQKGMNYHLDISYKNLGGEGRKISFLGFISQDKNQYAISNPGDTEASIFLGRKIGIGYVEPYLLDLPITGKINLIHKGVADRIRKIQNIIEASIFYFLPDSKYERSLNTFLNFKFNRELASSVQEDSLLSIPNSFIISLGQRLKFDLRNNISWPTSGSIYEAELKKAFILSESIYGGDYSFWKWNIASSFYLDLGKNFVWANKANFTSYHEIKRKNSKLNALPASERLIVDPVKQVRGFHEPLGPYLITSLGKKDVTGGTKRALIKTEIRHRLTKNIISAFFIDLGNTFYTIADLNQYKEALESVEKSVESEEIEDQNQVYDNFNYTLNDFIKSPKVLIEKNYLSYGLSLGWIIPLGSLSINLAAPWKEPKSDYCHKDYGCYKRAHKSPIYWKRLKIDFNISTDF